MRTAIEKRFRTRDGVEIFYRHWPAEGQRQGALLLLHRGHEHSGRLAHLADELDMPGHALFAWDMRAHGLSGGQQDNKTTMSIFVEDLDQWCRHLRESEGLAEEEIAVVAQSIGAVIAAAWVHDFAPKIRALVLAAPAFDVRLYVPLARFFLQIWYFFVGNFQVTSYVKASALTHDPARIASYQTDPLIKRPISVQLLLGLYEMSERIVADAAAIRVPCQIVLSGSDWVVQNKAPHEFLKRLGSEWTEVEQYAGLFHDVLGEKDRQKPIAAIRGFLEKVYSRPREVPSLAIADRTGYTASEYWRNLRELPVYSPQRWFYAAQRLFLGTIGKLSRGIRIGEENGYDSGASLDYVYENKARGWSALGKLIDRIYLEAIGWRGIRVRKQLLQDSIGEAASRLRADAKPLRLIDIAAGQGRYVLQAETKFDDVLLRDFEPVNVEAGRRLAAGFGSPVEFQVADAFAASSYAGLEKSRTLGIISGLFELFPKNEEPQAALAGLAQTIAAGGYLIYTGQPWHPQLEMIARTLKTLRGGLWVMRRRTQAELDELVEAAGFQKVAQRIDPWGLFTVSIAKRLP